MLSLLKKIFGSKTTTEPVAPYKVEAPAAKPAEFPVPNTKPARAEKKTADKKPAAKTKPARKLKTAK